MECDVLTRNCDHTRIAGAGGGLVRAVAQSVIEGSVGSRVGQRIETPEMVSYLERVGKLIFEVACSLTELVGGTVVARGHGASGLSNNDLAVHDDQQPRHSSAKTETETSD
jgi:hypothetical protein